MRRIAITFLHTFLGPVLFGASYLANAQVTGGGGAQIEEIVVTAEKRAVPLQDVPVSLSAIGGEELQQIGAGQFEDFARYVPGLNYLSNGTLGQHQLILRGVTVGLSPAATVGVYVDDVPFGSSSSFSVGGLLALDLLPYDLERIEVLRGPQGTLYGASTMGGLLKYVTRDADLSHFAAQGEIDYQSISGGGSDAGGKGMINLPLSDGRAGLRVSGYDVHNPGYINDDALGLHDLNSSEQRGGRATFLARLTDDLSVRLTAILQDLYQDGTSAIDVNATTGQYLYGDLTQHRTIVEPFSQRYREYAATINWSIPFATLTSVTSYSTLDTSIQSDQSNAFGLPSYGINTPGTDKFTQELRLASPTGAQRQIDWLLGAFFTHEIGDNAQQYYTNPQTQPPLLLVGFPSDYKEYAGFGNITYHATDAFEVTAGLRWSHNTQDFTVSQTGLFNNPTDPAAVSTTPGHSSDQSTTYLVAAAYHFTQDVMAYARAASGYRPGGPNVQTPGSQGLVSPTFKPDKLWSYEAGVKSEYLDRRLLIDVSAFDIRWKDIQLLEFLNGFSFLGNGPGATTYGAEFTSIYKPLAGLTLGLNGAYTRAYLTGDTNSPLLGGVDGESLPLVPHWNTSATADYSLPISGGLSGFGGATFQYVGARNAYFNESISSQQFLLHSYDTLDLRAGLAGAHGRTHWTLTAFLKNATDKRGQTSVATPAPGSPAPASLFVVQPRTVGLAVQASF